MLEYLAVDRKDGKLPEGYKETRATDKTIHISYKDIPWLDKDGEDISLVKVILVSGAEFYLGSAITHPALIKAANKVKEQGSNIQQTANLGFYREIRSLADPLSNYDLPKLQHPKTNITIFYSKNDVGIRTYFMQYGKIDDKPVIVKLATCTKSGQDKVLNIISTS